MRGYKVFNPNWMCRDFQYEVGKTYKMEEEPRSCCQGFHFCTELKDCFSYYDFDSNNKVAIVEATGKIDSESDDSKHCTNEITIIRELTWHEVLNLVNIGKDCTGFCNSGNRNSGNCNSGYCNSGDYNSGNCNSGSRNSGDCNSGSRNSGYCNSGDCNSGNCNSGYRNSGNCNSGNWNSGDRNSGNRNSGDYNSGDYNSGNRNSGNWNSGNWNSGDWNSGDWNDTSFSNGIFNTKEAKIFMFDKLSDWTYRDWLNSEARIILGNAPCDEIRWVYSEDMTDEEKENHLEHKTTGGFLRTTKADRQKWWNELSKDNKEHVKTLPNFSAEIFERITGIKID